MYPTRHSRNRLLSLEQELHGAQQISHAYEPQDKMETVEHGNINVIDTPSDVENWRSLASMFTHAVNASPKASTSVQVQPQFQDELQTSKPSSSKVHAYRFDDGAPIQLEVSKSSSSSADQKFTTDPDQTSLEEKVHNVTVELLPPDVSTAAEPDSPAQVNEQQWIQETTHRIIDITAQVVHSRDLGIQPRGWHKFRSCLKDDLNDCYRLCIRPPSPTILGGDRKMRFPAFHFHLWTRAPPFGFTHFLWFSKSISISDFSFLL